jgi:hypothetical protein
MAEWGFKALFAVTLLLVLGLGGVGVEGKIQLTKQPRCLFPPSPSSIPTLDLDLLPSPFPHNPLPHPSSNFI